MAELGEAFVGIDVVKLRNAVAIAEDGRTGEVRYLGEFDADEVSMRRLVKRLATKHGKVTFCYEAGPTGYGLHRLIRSMGFDCTVVAPSLIPRRPGDQVKTNRRDTIGLARLLRAGELTAVCTAVARELAGLSIRGGSGNLNSEDEWIAGLTAAMLAASRRQDEQATPPEPQPGVQGQGGVGCRERREDAGGAGAAV